MPFRGGSSVCASCLLTCALTLGLVSSAPLAAHATAAQHTAAQHTAAQDAGAAAQQLVERYSPVVVVRRYDELCGSDGEPYVPMTVDAVLGNPEVALRQVGNGDPVITWAPTARDLYGRGEGVYVDLPGDALRPGCLYATDSARYAPQSKSAVYAHVARQANRPDYLAVQYWLYWYYNDWNDKHESDWEFVQVLFRASSLEDALTKDPVSVGYAQHTGGETATWTADKLEREGSHPVVYSSERSHASYFEPALFLGRGSSEGFGCDDTESPTVRLRPRVVLLPDAASGPDAPFAWLAFRGRWGERQPAPNDGPTGPATKPRWSAPVDWQDDLRASSFVVPGGSAATPAVIDTFCSVVGAGSVLFVNFLASPAKVLTGLAVLLLILVFLLRRTSWRPVPPLPVVRRRRGGEIARASVALYRRRPLPYAALGLLVMPVGVLGAVLTAVLVHLPFVGDATAVTDAGDAGDRLLVATWVSAALLPLSIVLVSGAVAWLLQAQGEHAVAAAGGAGAGREPRALDAVTGERRRVGSLTVSFLLAALLVVLLSLTVVGLPAAIWLLVRFQFLAQVSVLEGLNGRAALVRTGVLVRGRWLHTALIALLTWGAVYVVGALVGLLLLVSFTELPLWAVTAAALATQVALLPLGAIVLTLTYGDARAQPRTPRRERSVLVAAGTT